MHNWGDEKVDWTGIGDAAFEIGQFIARWGRIGVLQTKEKFGTARVYCSFGFDCFHGIIWPFKHWIHSWWPYRFDLWLTWQIRKITPLVRLIDRYQCWIYRLAYKRAIKKRPHLKEEILYGADQSQLLEGL